MSEIRERVGMTVGRAAQAAGGRRGSGGRRRGHDGLDDACPVFSGTRYEDWEVPDPSGRDLDGVRAIRDQIDRRVRRLASELTAPA